MPIKLKAGTPIGTLSVYVRNATTISNDLRRIAEHGNVDAGLLVDIVNHVNANDAVYQSVLGAGVVNQVARLAIATKVAASAGTLQILTGLNSRWREIKNR